MSSVVSIDVETASAVNSSVRSLSRLISSRAALTTKRILSASKTRRANGQRLSPITIAEIQRRVSSMIIALSIMAKIHEVLQQLRPLQRQKTLRMKLHAVQRPGSMPNAHDLAFLGPGADDEIGMVERFA